MEDIKSHWLALTQEVDTVIQSLQRQLLESQNRLMETNRNSLIEQVNLLKKLDTNTRESAEEVKSAKVIVLEESKTLNQKIDTKLLKTEEKIDLLFKKIEQKIEMQMNSFKEEMKYNILEHQQVIDRKLTEFLNRQNTLIQNLTQQIDSYNRVSQAQATEFLVIKANISDLLTLKPEFNETQIKLVTQDERLAKVESSLEEILEKLKKSFWVGGKFK